MNRIPQTEKEWLEAGFAVRLERDPDFQARRVSHPLVARVLMAAEKNLDSSYVAFHWGDKQEADRCVAARVELHSWLDDDDQETAETPPQVVARLVRNGVPVIEAIIFALTPKKRARGRRISNRLPILLAYEQRLKNPELSWMQLAIRYCRCGKAKHDWKCREKLRQQAMLLERVIRRLGV